jgi:hypothetical protein
MSVMTCILAKPVLIAACAQKRRRPTLRPGGLIVVRYTRTGALSNEDCSFALKTTVLEPKAALDDGLGLPAQQDPVAHDLAI